MTIEIKGVVHYFSDGHGYVDVVVSEDETRPYLRHSVGIDIKPNRGRIITFLGNLYGVPPGEIVWPEHIVLKEDSD